MHCKYRTRKGGVDREKKSSTDAMALRRLHLPNTAVAARSGRPFLLKRQLRTCTTCAPQQMSLHHPAGAVGTTHFSSSSTSNGASGAVGVSASLTALHRPDVWSGELPLAAVKKADAVRQSLLSLLRSATPPYLSVLHFNHLLMETMGLSEETPVNNGAIEGVGTPRPFKVAEMDAACLAAAWKVISLHCYFSAETSGSATAVTDHIGGAAPLTSEFIASLRVVPLDWRAALQNVAKEVPYEGWTEAELMSRLHHQYPVLVKYPLFRPNGFVGTLSAPSLCVGVWVQKNLSSLLLVTRSAVTGQLLYHNASSNGVSVIWQPMGPLTSSTSDMTAPPGDDPLFCAAIQHALHAVGRGKQLPVWTEVGAINPLLPSSLGITASGGGSAAWQRRYDSSAMLQQLFHLSSYIHIRAAEAVHQTCVVVDTFTLSPAEVKAMAVHHSAFCPKAGFAVKLMMRRAMEKETMRQKRQSYLDAFASSTAVAEVVFVDAPLEPVHMLGAVVELYATGGGASTSSALRSNNSKDVMSATAAPAGPQEGPRVSSDNEKASRMLVMCGESQRGCFEDILKDVATPNVKVILITPQSSSSTQ